MCNRKIALTPISKADLFARLAEGQAARTTVVTPNRRLSQALMADIDAWQAAKGLAAWEAPDILPFDAYVQRLWEEALYSETQNTPALSAYFELMDKLLPGFLSTLSTQKIRGTRTLIK